jgi:hypothetical protein
MSGAASAYMLHRLTVQEIHQHTYEHIYMIIYMKINLHIISTMKYESQLLFPY